MSVAIRKMWLALAAFLLFAVTARAEQQRDATVVVLHLDAALSTGKTLSLHLGVSGGKVVAATATGWNSQPHDIDAAGLKLTGDAISGTVQVTLVPDPFLPADGKALPAAYEIDAKISDGSAAGHFTGTCGSTPVKGGITGNASPAPDPQGALRLEAKLFHPLVRLWEAKGSNYKYALDMSLLVTMKQGRAHAAAMETVVPDYRRYSATVRKSDLTLDGFALSGTLEVMVNYGGGEKAATEGNEELHAFTLRGVVVGDVVAGTYDTRVGKLSATGDRFVGSVSREAPPAPAASLATLRLHRAMNEGGPVILNLALNADSPVHGYALAPGYNHMRQSLDATGLELDGDRLRGSVKVSILPDVYRPPERVEMEYKVDVTIDGFAATGTFEGEDRGQPIADAVTGQLRAKKAPKPLATTASLRRCALKLRYCMPQAPKGSTDATVELELADGALRIGRVISGGEPISAVVEKATVNIEDDRVTGSLSYTVADGPAAGTYAFDFEALADGATIDGWWVGRHNDKAILTKSAKLYGMLNPSVAATREAGEP